MVITENPSEVSPVALPAIAGGVPVRSRQSPLIFGRPAISEAAVDRVVSCLRSQWVGLGPLVEEFESRFGAYRGAPYAVAVSSGTAALELALRGLRIGPGDEVIVPSITFCSTVHAIVHAGATPVLADSAPDGDNVSAAEIGPKITPRTRAILVVHMRGQCCDMGPILELAQRHNLRVIEDCAHAIESTYSGQSAGLLGDAGCFSFYATKSITTGDGGMVITPHKRLALRVKRLRAHGLNSDAWTRRGMVANPYAFTPGFKYNLTDYEAALGLGQLESIDAHWAARETIWRAYEERLPDLPLRLPGGPPSTGRHAYHLYSPLLLLDKVTISRDDLRAALAAEGIGTGIHYRPVHTQPYYRRTLRVKAQDLPRAAWIGQRTFSLPLSPSMSPADVGDVCEALGKILRYFSVDRPSR